MRHFNGILCALCLLAVVLRGEHGESGGDDVGGVSRSAVSEVALAAPTVPRLRHGGGVVANSIATEVGTLKREFRVLTVSGRGSWVECDMTLPPAGSSDRAPLLMLEIQEIHDRRPDVFGYTVLVNDHEVYFRTYKEMGAGPNHYFVQFDRTLAPDGKLRVRFRNEGEAPFSVARVWAYADFLDLAEQDGTYRKMTICASIDQGLATAAATLLGAPKYDAAAQPGVSEEGYAKQLWTTLKSRFDGTPYVPGVAFGLEYAKRAVPQVRETMDARLAELIELDVPYQIVFSGGEWGAHPMGLDGLGGSFADGKYSTVRYDPVAGLYRPTWPYSPGGITGPTWNDRQLQKFLAHRLQRTAGYYAERLAFLKAKGTQAPSPLVLQDWGLGCVPFGDCNDGAIRDAKADGVTLTPEDGLGADEKVWIYRNLSRVPARSAATFRKAVGRDAILVDRGEIRLPKEQLQDQYYFHTWYEPVYPFYDDRWAMWQTGVGPQVWTTGETGPHLPAAYFDYVIALGKLACVNLERAFFEDNLDYMHTLYQRGFLLVTPINTHKGDLDRFLPAAATVDARPCAPALHCERTLLDVNFLRDKTWGPAEQVVSVSNLVIPYGRGSALPSRPFEYLHVDDVKDSNWVTYRVTNNGQLFDRSPVIEISGVLHPGEDNAVVILAGGDPAALQPLATITANQFVKGDHWPWAQTARLNLGDRMIGHQEWYVQLQLHTSDWRNLLLKHIKVTIPWEERSGHPGGEPFTVRQTRIMRLWVQDRAVFERIHDEYRRLRGEDEVWRQAGELAMKGHYRGAYRLLAGELSLVLPARFAVRGYGRLGPYPIGVRLSDDDQVAVLDLLQTGPEEFEFRMKVDRAQTCRVAFNELPETWRYRFETLGENHFRLVRVKHGEPSIEGKLEFPIVVGPVNDLAHRLPERLTGAFAGYRLPDGLWVDTQAAALWLDNPIFVPVAKGAALTRTRDGSDEQVGYGIWGKGGDGGPSDGDKVEVFLDASGVAQEIRSSYGRDGGRIRKFEPPVFRGETHNGIIELDNGHRYELANVNFPPQFVGIPGLKSGVRQHRVEDLIKALQPGLEVDIRYCPYTYNNRLPRIITIKASATRNNPTP